MSETQLMLIYVILSIILDGCSVLANANKKLKDVLITVEYRPESCDVFAEDGDKITIEYTGYLESGLEFDSTSLAERGPLNFTLGTNTVIPGLERGILGMCFGEKRKLVIPSHLAYGNQGYRTIPEYHVTELTNHVCSNKSRDFMGYFVSVKDRGGRFYRVNNVNSSVSCPWYAGGAYFHWQCAACFDGTRGDFTSCSGDSTIFFDVAMTRLKKKSILERSVTAVQFFLFPLSTTLIIFYLWQKMNESEEPLQQSNRKSKRNRRRG